VTLGWGHVTLRTKAAQSYYISTCHWDDPCQISLHLVYSSWPSEDFEKNSPFWPLSGGGAVYDPRNFICTNLNLLVQGCFIPNINAYGSLVCERNIFQIPNISPIVASLWAPKGSCPLICAHFNPHTLKILPTKFG